MTKKIFLLGLTLALAGTALGCGDDDVPPPPPPVDGGMRDMNVDMNTTDIDAGGDVDMGTAPGLTCAAYCTLVTTNCTAANAQYADMAECMTQCTTAAIPAGTAGMMDGNTLGCRLYHGGVAATDPATHCPHTGLSGGGVCGTVCEAYCGLIQGSCTGANQQYPDADACLRACEVLPATGTIGATDGDTVQCRLYHATVSIGDAAMHCAHAGATGGGVCGAALAYDFRTGAPATYTQFDRMGMPAVATALIPTARKVAYNQATPAEDALLAFGGDLLGSLGALHTALDDDIMGATLRPCSMATGAMFPICVEQTVGAGGPTVVSLVVPDTLQINTDAAAGFPNGRRLADPVIDVTLSVILLDLSSTTGCGGAACTPTTLVGVLNPAANDKAFSTTFPFVASPHNVP